MTGDEFKDVLDKLGNELHRMTATKGREYRAGDPDQFANFNRLAAELGLDRKMVWAVYFTKHVDGIKNYIRTGQEPSEPIEGRIIDAVLYLSLLLGMVKEDKEKGVPAAVGGREHCDSGVG